MYGWSDFANFSLLAISQGLMWAIMAVGIYTTFRILDFADMTAEGSLTMGAAVTARLLTMGMHPLVGMAVSCLAGVCAGLVTGLLHTKLKIPPLLSGILTMTGLYSVNLRVMGKANIPLMNAETALTMTAKFLGLSERNASIVVGAVCVLFVILILWWFYNTEIGYAVRATGNNEQMIKALGVNTNNMKILGLAIGNALVALSGSLVCQYNGFSDIGMGTGTIVTGLAAVIVGEVIFSDKNNHKVFFSVVAGSILYRMIISWILTLGFQPTDLRGITSIMLAFALALPVLSENFSFFKYIRQMFSGSEQLRSEAWMQLKEWFGIRLRKLRKKKVPVGDGLPMLRMEDLKKTFDVGTPNEKEALCGVNLTLRENDFVTVIGGNGAGKSTILNAVSGALRMDSGEIQIDGVDVSDMEEYARAKYIGRVFQDPRMGTATNMTIEENLSMAYRRGKKRTLRWGVTKEERELFRDHLKRLGLGLEDRMGVKAGLLSGGQRQALTLMMATLVRPKLLLLDEHTAALDPKTAKIVLDITGKLIAEGNLTSLMVTHNMKDALRMGNRIAMMHEGDIVLDIEQEQKNDLTVNDLLEKFEKASGDEISSDRMLLS